MIDGVADIVFLNIIKMQIVFVLQEALKVVFLTVWRLWFQKG